MLRRGADDGEVSDVAAASKIRKRCALSSSGGGATSDTLRRLRLKKRGVVVLGVSPWSSRKMSESSWNGRHGVAGAADSTASARKLVGALRQLSSPDDENAARRSSAAHRRCVSVELSKRSRTKSKTVLEGDGQRSWHNGHGHWFSDMLSNGSAMEVHACRSQGCASPSPCSRGGETMSPHMKEMCSSLAASKELVRALAGIWCPGGGGGGDGGLIPSTPAAAVNARLGTALADAEREAAAARREVERERRSRERIEKVFDEMLVRGGLAGNGGGEEEIRAVQEELEKEREMLRLADELREERVQMKLLDARLQFEEKNAVVEQLRVELEAFLDTKKQQPPPPDNHRFQSIPVAAANKNGDDDGNDDEEEDGGGSRGEEDGSDGSEMHSIELNMEGNSKDHYSWSYTTASNSKEMTMARSKNAESLQHGSLAAALGMDRHWQEAGVGEEVDGDRWDDGGCSERSKDVDEEDAERYQAIKNLREQMLAGHGFVFVSQDWGQC
uniref:GTD-binding domain-containing protein n=1 Tax=Leersia perrieri TaxID=77586 RepID=A0A0D9VG88_9ORYZ